MARERESSRNNIVYNQKELEILFMWSRKGTEFLIDISNAIL